jgi:2-polyprenyl-3-methyl-5-hydroxy-6-metoxy-1,4-benzoquinol methylase
MPSAEEISELYHEDFDHFAPYIDQTAVHHAYFKQKVEEIGVKIKDLRLKSKEKNNKIINPKSEFFYLRLLDIGCLTGVLLEEARDRGFAVTGIDLSADAVRYCNKRKLKTYNGTVYTVKELKNNSFDVVTAFQIVEHERDPVRMLKRIHLLLKKSGVVVLATPDVGGFWSNVMGKRWFGFRHPEHVVLLDFNSMRTLLEKSGFRDIEIRHDSPRPFPLSFAFTRAADYFPMLSWFLRPAGKLLDRFKITNPVNPWDDMIAVARK